MRGPACDHVLSGVTACGINVDVCRGGCGGIWFDRYEPMKVDESREPAGEALLRIERAADVSVDHNMRLSCPKCPGVVMMRHFFSVKRQAAADGCPSCGGYRLDVGELAAIRTEFRTEEERDRAARYFSELFDEELAAEHAKTMEDLESARRVARVLRFICPSYHIPGKQDRGHFDGGLRANACISAGYYGEWRQRMSSQTKGYLIDARSIYESDTRQVRADASCR